MYALLCVPIYEMSNIKRIMVVHLQTIHELALNCTMTYEAWFINASHVRDLSCSRLHWPTWNQHLPNVHSPFVDHLSFDLARVPCNPCYGHKPYYHPPPYEVTKSRDGWKGKGWETVSFEGRGGVRSRGEGVIIGWEAAREKYYLTNSGSMY